MKSERERNLFMATLISSRGYFTINKVGETSAGRPKYSTFVRVTFPISRVDVLYSAMDTFGGRVDEVHYSSNVRAWTQQGEKAVLRAIEAVRSSGVPLPWLISEQIRIVEDFLELKVKRGPKTQTKREQRVWEKRAELYNKMQQLHLKDRG